MAGRGAPDGAGAGRESARQQQAKAKKKGGGKAVRDVVCRIRIVSAPAGARRMIGLMLRGFSVGASWTPDGTGVSVNVEREKAGKLLYSIRKLLPSEEALEVNFTQAGTDITQHVVRDAVRAEADAKPSQALSPELQARARAARQAAADGYTANGPPDDSPGFAGDEDDWDPNDPDGEGDGMPRERGPRGALNDDGSFTAAPPPAPRERERSQPDQGWGWAKAPKPAPPAAPPPPRAAPKATGGGFAPGFGNLAAGGYTEGVNGTWPYGEQYRPQDEDKLAGLARIVKPRDSKKQAVTKTTIVIGPNSDRRYVVQLDREINKWTASRMTVDFSNRRQVGVGETFGAAVRGIIAEERRMWAPASAAPPAPPKTAPKTTSKATPVPRPTPAAEPSVGAPATASPPGPAAAAPAMNFTSLVANSSGLPHAPRWAVTVKEKIVAMGDDIEVVMQQAHHALGGAGMLVLGWNGKMPAAPVVRAEQPIEVDAATQQRLQTAMARARGGPPPAAAQPEEVEYEDDATSAASAPKAPPRGETA